MKPKIKIFLIILVFGLTLSNLASAALVNCGGSGQSPCQIKDIVWLIERVINFLLASAWMVSIFYIIWAAYILSGSNGNEETISNGKAALSNAIIGFFLIMVSYLLVNFLIFAFTGKAESGPNGAFETVFDLIRKP